MTKAFEGFKNVRKPKKRQLKEKSPAKAVVRHEAESKWYEYGVDEKTNINADSSIVAEMELEAKTLYQRDINLYNRAEEAIRGSEAKWLATVLTRGTAADRTAALQLSVKKSPVHAFNHIASLVSIVEKKNTRDAYSVLGVLKDLFLNELLPHDRKLIPFSARPFSELKELSNGGAPNKERRLILWKFESDLKDIYRKFVDAIERLAGSAIEKISCHACHAALDLLAECPEQENKLLSLLVNKLGHPNHKLATKVCEYLLELTYRQPKMRSVVVDEVERLIFRKNVPNSTQLYAVSFLSQVQLQRGEHKFALHLLSIYFGLFRMLVASSRVEDKMMSILLCGTNRAYPFAEVRADELEVEMNLLYKVLHQGTFRTALQTLKLLSRFSSGKHSDRFYNALYRRMSDINHSSRLHNQLLKLLYEVLTKDADVPRLCLSRNAAFAAGSLLMISKLTMQRPELLIFSKKAQQIVFDDEEEEHFVDAEENIEAQKESEEPKTIPKKVTGASHSILTSSWIHEKNIALRSIKSTYCPLNRNPSFARAESTVTSELLLLRTHYHPSVALFANNLLKRIPVQYDGDPLNDFTSMRFLDRFVFKKPKTRKSDEEFNVKKISKRKVYNPSNIKKLPVTSKEYIEKEKEKIPVDERYLHRFTTSLSKLKKEKTKNDEDIEFDDTESVNSVEFEQLLTRFEPGEKNELFEIDFAKEFSTEKKTRSKRKRNGIGDSEDDEESGDEDAGYDESSSGDMNEEDDLEEEDDDGIVEDEESDEGSKVAYGEESSEYEYSDNDFAEKLSYAEDAAISADKACFSHLL